MPYYPSLCETFIPHNPDPCEDREYGRIRSAGFIRAGFIFNTTSTTPDPTDTQEWINGITAGQIVIIPETNGDSPKASPVMGPRYGLHAGAVLGYDFEATYEDPNYNSNCSFYNQLIGNLNYSFFYRTSTHVYLTESPATIIPNRAIKNDLLDDIVWEVQVKWISNQFACGIAIPDSVFNHAPYFYTLPSNGGGIVTGNTHNYNFGGTIGTLTSGGHLVVNPNLQGFVSNQTHIGGIFSETAGLSTKVPPVLIGFSSNSSGSGLGLS